MAILTPSTSSLNASKHQSSRKYPDILSPLRRWIDQIQIKRRWTAYLLCKVIPSRCPFEREVSLFGHTIQIPALCKLNPLYNEVVSLRFRALTYLADTCGEDVKAYTR